MAKPRKSRRRRLVHRHGPSLVLDKPAVERAWRTAARALAARLRELREARGWGIEEAAEVAGLHAKHLQRLERLEPQPSHDPNATLKTLVALATAYGVTLGALFDAPGSGSKRKRST